LITLCIYTTDGEIIITQVARVGRHCHVPISRTVDSYIDALVREAGSAAKAAAVCKTAKYKTLDRMYIFKPCGGIFEPIQRRGLLILANLGQKILVLAVSGDDWDSSFLFRCFLVLIQ